MPTLFIFLTSQIMCELCTNKRKTQLEIGREKPEDKDQNFLSGEEAPLHKGENTHILLK